MFEQQISIKYSKKQNAYFIAFFRLNDALTLRKELKKMRFKCYIKARASMTMRIVSYLDVSTDLQKQARLNALNNNYSYVSEDQLKDTCKMKFCEAVAMYFDRKTTVFTTDNPTVRRTRV